MRNDRGDLTECATSNLFIVRSDTVLTPPVECGLLPGITRELLFEIGRNAGIEVREQVLRDKDLFDADEAFLTGTAAELTPIREVDDRQIGAGRRGPITEDIQNIFFEVIKGKAPEKYAKWLSVV
jgi:branched-chain amino acid aminotransferase